MKILLNFSLIILFSLQYNVASADIGDGNTGIFSSETEQSQNSSFGKTNNSFGISTFGDEENVIMDHEPGHITPPPFPTPSVPLDGGASLLLIGGAGLGLARLFRKKNGVNNE